jgi:hypothetical protein
MVHDGLDKKQNPISKITRAKGARGMIKVVECLPKQLRSPEFKPQNHKTKQSKTKPKNNEEKDKKNYLPF